jgi:hypothetical protein
MLTPTVLKLSDNPSLTAILRFKEATKSHPILEMRNKFGMLLGLATGLKGFQNLKSKKKEFVYNVETQYSYTEDSITQWISQDAIIQPYVKKTFFDTKEDYLKAFQNSEKFWEDNLEKFNKSNSVLKECPDVLILGF